MHWSHPMLRDRDGGPILGRLVSVSFVQARRRTRLPPDGGATVMPTLDPLARAAVLGVSWFLEHVLRLRPRYVDLRLPAGRVLTVKVGIAGRRDSAYTAAPRRRPGAPRTRHTAGAGWDHVYLQTVLRGARPD